MSQSDFPEIFNHLKAYLKNYEHDLVVKQDNDSTYYLDSEKVFPKNKKPYFFGAVTIKKNYVSYHLMPVYMFPDLLEDLSPNLKKHMQGKSCFNFKKTDLELFQELEKLTVQSFERFKKENMI